METDGEQGHLGKPLSYRLWKHVRYFSACHSLWYKLLLTQRDAMHSVKEINGFHDTGLESCLPNAHQWCVLNISSNESSSDLSQKSMGKMSTHRFCNSLSSLWIFKSSLKNWLFLNQAIIHVKLSLNSFLMQRKLFKQCSLEERLAIGTNVISIMEIN